MCERAEGLETKAETGWKILQLMENDHFRWKKIATGGTLICPGGNKILMENYLFRRKKIIGGKLFCPVEAKLRLLETKLWDKLKDHLNSLDRLVAVRK